METFDNRTSVCQQDQTDESLHRRGGVRFCLQQLAAMKLRLPRLQQRARQSSSHQRRSPLDDDRAVSLAPAS